MNKNKINTVKKYEGFTLIEILVVIGIIAILAAIVLIAINPAKQFAQSRNTQRTSNVNAILNAIGQRMADNKGLFTGTGCTTPLPSTTPATEIKKTGGYDMRPCIVPSYIAEIPVDPSGGSLTCTDAACSSGDYDTKYTVFQDGTTQRVTVCAPLGAEPSVPGSGPICITR